MYPSILSPLASSYTSLTVRIFSVSHICHIFSPFVVVSVENRRSRRRRRGLIRRRRFRSSRVAVVTGVATSTDSSAVAERPRDASCLTAVTFNSTSTTAFYWTSYFDFR